MTENETNVVEEREPYDIQDPTEVVKAVVAEEHSSNPEPVTEEAAPAGDEHSAVEETAKERARESGVEATIGKAEDYLDSELASAVEKILGSMTAKVSELERKLAARVEASPKEAASATSLFAGREHIFGSDAPSPTETSNRQRVTDQMQILRSGYKAMKKNAPSDSDLFNKAMRSEFPDASINEERNSFRTKIQDRERQIISRPSSRTGESTSARDRAKKAVESRMRELGLSQ
jgi:hypothetical protein